MDLDGLVTGSEDRAAFGTIHLAIQPGAHVLAFPRSPAIRASIGLVLGTIAGFAISMSSSHALRLAAAALEPLGIIWVNAIRMTVIPLVVSLLVATIASEHDLAAVGRLGARAMAVFVALLSGVALIGLLAAPPLYALFQPTLHAGSAYAAATVERTGAPTAALPGFGSWLAGLVPANPLSAAAQGAMLPVVVFAILLGAAMSRVASPMREAGAGFFRGVADAMLVIVGWILAVAPVGVFALALTLTLKLGLSVAGAIGFYLLVHVGLVVVAGALLYLLVAAVGGVPVSSFARATAPAQLVAVATRSSVAALPAMIDGAERTLRLPIAITSFVLPFGVSIFRLNQGITWIVSALFVGELYGVHLGWSKLALLAVASVAMSFSVPGIPSGALFMIAPFFVAVGLPADGIGILIALDVIPDLFKTSLNVTGHMTATVLLARHTEPAPGVIAPPVSVEARAPAYR